jgi:hypothetical protein
MPVRVTIETASRAEAELIARKLPVEGEARSWRGLGVIRVGVRDKTETNALIDAVARTFREHNLKWTRVRYGDEERVFKANGRRPG